MRSLRALSKLRVTMFRWWISSGRRSMASLMCQYACLPAPKTVTSCTDWRVFSNIVEQSAVRNAVISSALSRPVVFPMVSSKVSEPRIVVAFGEPEATDVCPVPMLSAGLIGREVEEDVAVSCLDMEKELRGVPEVASDSELLLDWSEFKDIWSTRLGKPAASGGMTFTTLMP